MQIKGKLLNTPALFDELLQAPMEEVTVIVLEIDCAVGLQ